MTENVAAATAFLNAMKTKDLSQAPLSDNVSYQSPLSGEPIEGRDHVCRFLEVYLPVIHDVQIERQIADGDHVALVWEADTSFGPLSIVYVVRVERGKIVKINAFYDPRGFLERMGGWTGA